MARAKKPPTAEQMKAFAAKYSAKDWKWLCRDDEFVKVVATDLQLAEKMANKKLS
jgi:hypothetical protein